MATYKVIQDIEAEDKLVGPLSLRQFLYALGGLVGGYLCFLSVQRGAPFLLVVFLPITLGVIFFAVPWRKEQSTEVWALAHIRFYVMPRKRIWNQSGIREYVRVIAKPKVRKVYNNGLSQTEVQSRLKALATTIDSRGWAVKGATAEDLAQIDPLLDPTMSDRLVGSTEMPKEAMSHLKIHDDIASHEDMLHEDSAHAQKLSGMIDRQTAERHERLAQKARQDAIKAAAAEQAAAQSQPQSQPRPQVMPAQPTTAYGTQITTKASMDGPATGQWFVNAPGTPVAGPTQITIIAPGTPQVSTAASAPSEDEKALATQLKANQQGAQQAYYGHLKVLSPLKGKGTDKTEAEETPVQQPRVDKAVTAPREARAPRGHTAAAAKAASARSIEAPKVTARADEATEKPVVEKPAVKAAPAKPAPKPAPKPADVKETSSEMTSTPDPAILELASNDDLDIATIARQINKHKSPNEVEIRLH